MTQEQKIILVRHGETEINAIGKTHQFLDAEQLNATGIEQIRKTAQKLVPFLPLKIYSSTEPRAIQSAKIISDELHVPFEQIPDFVERNWGELSGKPWPEIKQILDKLSLDERRCFLPEGGESWEQFEKRLITGLESALAKSESKNIAIVAHGGVLTVLMPHLLNGPPEEALKPEHMFDNASITVFNYNGASFKLMILNDTSHLK